MEAAPSSTITLHEGHALGEQIAEQGANLDAATHRLLTDLRVFDASGAWHAQGAQTCAKWLVWRLGWDGGRVREHVRVATRLAELPLIEARRHPDEDKVVRTVSTRDRDDGMVTLSAVLHPDEAAAVWEALTKVAGADLNKRDRVALILRARAHCAMTAARSGRGS